MKIEYFTIDELNYFKEHCDFTEDELNLLDEKSKGKTLEETGFDINTLKSVKRKIRTALEDRETKTMTVAEIKEYIDKRQEELGNSDPYEEYAWYDISAELTQIRSMLDELKENK